jgi:serine protease
LAALSPLYLEGWMNLRKSLSFRFLVVGLTLAALAFMMGQARMATAANQAAKDTVRIWVEWQPGKSDAVRNSLDSNGAQVHYKFDDLNSFVATIPGSAMSRITNNPNVAGWETDVPRQIYGTGFEAVGSFIAAVNSDSVVAGQQVVPWGVTRVQATQVWDLNSDGHVDTGATNGAGRKVCIIDTGYYLAHPDLGDSVTGYSQQSTTWSVDGNGHGSHVAGTIAGTDNNEGVIGVAPGVSLHIIKFFNDAGVATFSSDLVDAANRCGSAGANVISMSLGGGAPSTREQRAFDTLYSNGVLNIAAAGNDGNTVVNYPAGYGSVMSVAATDIGNNIADFSQQNADVEIAAPGVDVLSTVPYIDTATLTAGSSTWSGNLVEFAALGTVSGTLADGGLCDATNAAWSGKVVLCSRGNISFYDKVHNVQLSGGKAAVIYNNVANESLHATLGEGFTSTIPAIGLTMEDGVAALGSVGQSSTVTASHQWPVASYSNYDGTSMATPHVSAVAALIWSKNPTWTNVQVRQALTSSAFDLGAAGRDVTFGYGLVQAKSALDYACATFGGCGGGGGTSALHVSALVGSAVKSGNGWKASVTVTVVDQNGSPVSGAAVTIAASGGASGSATCTTATTGKCTVTTSRLGNSVTSVTFTVTNVSKSGSTYDSGANAANSVTVNKP